ncbi:MAG: HD domain-containing protein [Oscillospiraceae bacterium]|nr:HD domain-containing protein [Oscillospiraceae bacterium]
MNKLDMLAIKMTEYDAGDAGRIQHFIKVHSFVRLIGIGENISEQELFVLEAAALTHDIGIKKANELYGRCDGLLQEQLGPDIAREMLSELCFEESEIERICYLIGHHHTYDNIDGADYQILVEADFLVNLYEGGKGAEAIKSAYNKIFKTKTGKELCRLMFSV